MRSARIRIFGLLGRPVYLDVSAWIPMNSSSTGSAATGFSLNPKKNLTAFSQHSDIDVGVVSSNHFEVAWRYLRTNRPSWLSLPARTRTALDSHRKNYIFWGTIAADRILSLLPFGLEWQAALDEMATCPPTEGRDVRLRIYRDYNALRSYQANGISRLRADLLEGVETDEPLPIEEA
jgi:hypothetical protein